jgi:S1-C subfamily serine protease
MAFQDEMTLWHEESITKISTLEKGIAGTLSKINAWGEALDNTQNKIDALEEEISSTQHKIGALEEETGGILAEIGSLDKEIKTLATKIPESGIDAMSIYQKVSPSVVRISSGDEVIGSGFIIDAEAHVVTAYHVVEQSPKINVILPDGNFSAAEIIGISKHSDVAVLKLEKQLLTQPLPLANSATVRIGEPVLVIGSPFELTETLTAGIVSQINRLAQIEYATEVRWVPNLIQFDAAVNFGNSGCPLFNAKGEVIGMVIARVHPQDGDGIYYAVSANKLERVAASLINQGFFDYPWLGVEIANLTPTVGQSRGLKTINGTLVKGVIIGSPAEAAGIKVDDIITAIEGRAIKNVTDLISYLGENTSPGDKITLELIRDGIKLELPVEIGKHPYL